MRPSQSIRERTRHWPRVEDDDPRPLAIELFAGLHGWGAGLAAAGFRVVGFDIADMPRMLNHPVPEHCSLVLQDVLTLHGSQFRDAHLIVASPPCQEFSYMAMPFSRGKRIAAALRGQGEFPEGYTGSRTIPELTALFDACFRIQREASEAAGRYIPMVVENVRGAQPWVGRAKWSYGSYYLWGDVPALMPTTLAPAKVAGLPNGGFPGGGLAQGYIDRQAQKVPGMNFHDHEKTGKPGRSFQSVAVAEHIKQGGSGAAWFRELLQERRKAATAAVKTVGHLNKRDGHGHTRHLTNQAEHEHAKAKGASGSTSRRAASALIAKIPFALAEYLGRVYYPHEDSCAQRDQRAKKSY